MECCSGDNIENAVIALSDIVAGLQHARQSKGSAEQQTDNTGSPKLPDVKNLEFAYDQQSIKDTNHRATEEEFDIVRFCYDWIVGQLRAGA
jgi:hypothetical protein